MIKNCISRVLMVAALAIGTTSLVLAEDEADFTVIDVIFNVLKPLTKDDMSDEQIDAGIVEANKLLKQAKIKIQRKGAVNRDVSDGGTGDDKDDGETPRDERDKLRDKGEKETDDKVGKGKGYKIYIASDCKPENSAVVGTTVHKIPVSILEVDKKSESFGNTIAHEMCHALTIDYHVDDEKSLMSETGSGSELSEELIEEITPTAEGRGTPKEKEKATDTPAPKEQKKAETIDPKSGEDNEQPGIPPHNDLRESQCFVPSGGPLASGAFQLRGLFDRNRPVQSQFNMLFDVDNDTQTGSAVVVDGTLLGVDAAVQIFITGDGNHPLEAQGQFHDISGGQSYGLHSVRIVTQAEFGDAFDNDGESDIDPILDEIEFALDYDLLPPLVEALSVGVQCYDSISGTLDEGVMTMLDHPLPGPHPALTLSKYGVEAGETLQALGNGYAPASEVRVYFDDELVATATTDNAGSFSTDVTTPQDGFGDFDWTFVTATDSAGGSDFAPLHMLVVGACCLPDGSCALYFSTFCDESGGTYLGHDKVCPLEGACIPHVDGNTPSGPHKGWIWYDAFPDLQSALDVARANPLITEIWVADGTYIPDVNGDRTRAFALVDGVAVYGGFAGFEVNRDDRDASTNVTILSGDLAADDGTNFANNSENSYHVVTAESAVGSVTLLDGFMVSGGNADGPSDGSTYFHDAGGGLRIGDAAPVIRNCHFVGNHAIFGGGVEIFFGSPTFENCTFSNNLADEFGGGLHNNRGKPALRDCAFTANSADGYGGAMRFVAGGGSGIGLLIESNSSSNGGGIALDRGSNPTLINLVLRANDATNNGGGMHLDRGASPLLANALIEGNRAESAGGGILIGADNSTKPELVHVTLSANRAGSGGGASVNHAAPKINNSILYFNEDNSGNGEAAQLRNDGGAVALDYSDVQGLTGGFVGVGNIGDDPDFVMPAVWDDNGTPNDPSDDFFLPGSSQLCAGSPCIDRGNTNALPQDTLDLDGDKITTELLPMDLLGSPRQLDDVGTDDAGSGSPPAVDLGMAEFRGATNLRGDSNGDGSINFADIDCFVAALIGVESWMECSGFPAELYLELNDINRDGSVDFEDIDAFVECLINGECPAYASLTLASTALTFWDLSPGAIQTRGLTIVNQDCGPLRIASVNVVGGEFFSVAAFDSVIDPEDMGAVHIAFAPNAEGDFSDTLMIETDPPSSEPLIIALIGHSREAVETPPVDSTRTEATYQSILPGEDGVHVHFLVEIAALGPTQRYLEMQLRVVGELPDGVEPRFSQDRVTLGRRELVGLDLFAPHGTAADDSEFTIVGDVYEDAELLFTVSSETLFAPGWWWVCCQTKTCDCPEGTPAATLNVLDTKTFDVKDAAPPAGKKPKDHTVAVATAVVSGPKAGECCKGATFEMTLTIDSQVAGANEDLTALFLIAGLCKKMGITVSSSTAPPTGGPAGTVGRGPNDSGFDCKDVGKKQPGRVQLKVTEVVPVTCTVMDECPCQVAQSKFITKFTITNAGNATDAGELEVHWSISISGKDCVITAVSGKIDAIIYLHGAGGGKNDVYDPKNDEFLDQKSDKDKDGKSNYDEVKNGTDPSDPKSK